MPRPSPVPLLCPERRLRKKPKRRLYKENFRAERADGGGRGRPIKKPEGGSIEKLSGRGGGEGGSIKKLLGRILDISPESGSPASFFLRLLAVQ